MNLKKYLPLLLKFKNLGIIVAVLGILGYTAYQISLIPAVAPTRTQIEEERASLSTSVAKFDTKTIEAISKQTAIPVDTTLRNVGKTDPFF